MHLLSDTMLRALDNDVCWESDWFLKCSFMLTLCHAIPVDNDSVSHDVITNSQSHTCPTIFHVHRKRVRCSGISATTCC